MKTSLVPFAFHHPNHLEMQCPHGIAWGSCNNVDCLQRFNKGKFPALDPETGTIAYLHRLFDCLTIIITYLFYADIQPKKKVKKKTSPKRKPGDVDAASEEPHKYLVCASCQREGLLRPHNHERCSTKKCPFYKPRRATTLSKSNITSREDGTNPDGGNSGLTKVVSRKATVVMGRKRALRASQLNPVIQATVRTMTQWLSEGNAVFSRWILHRLENGLDIPSLQQQSNIVRRCFAAVQRREGHPLQAKTDNLDAEIISRRDEYAALRPPTLEWIDGR
jgi:hypothetical protein